jgi:voltage-gated potassium channel
MTAERTISAHAIVAGFGLPGRLVAETLHRQRMPFIIIDRNPETAERCTTVQVVIGDIRDPATISRAAIERARLYVITIPDEEAIIAAIEQAKRLNPDVRIIARANYTSTGMKARQFGAVEVIIAEQLIAREMARAVEGASA